MPRQLRQRHLGSVLGILALVGAALGPLAAPASAAALNEQGGDGPTTAIIVAALIVMAYITLGGLTSAIYNEVLQFFIIIEIGRAHV